jgi:hypothetical protein
MERLNMLECWFKEYRVRHCGEITLPGLYVSQGARSQDRAKLSFFSQDKFVLFYRLTSSLSREKVWKFSTAFIIEAPALSLRRTAGIALAGAFSVLVLTLGKKVHYAGDYFLLHKRECPWMHYGRITLWICVSSRSSAKCTS